MRTALTVAVAVLIFLQAGYLALRAARRPGDRLTVGEGLALSYGLGVGLVTTQMLVFSLARIRFTAARIVVVWALAWLVHLALLRRGRVGAAPPIVSPPPVGRAPAWHSGAAALLLLPVVVVCAVMAFRAAFMPVWVWDSWAIWDIKARAFSYDGTVVPFISDAYYSLAHPDYPLLVPLAGTVVYLVLGAPHGVVQIVSVLFYGSTLAVFFGTLRRLGSGQAVAAALTAGLAFLPNLLQWSQHFQSESALVFYVLSFASYLYLHDRDRRRWYLIVAALMAGFLTQARAEGWLLVVPGALLLVARVITRDLTARRSAVRHAVGFVLVCAAVYAPWLVLKNLVAKVSGGVSQVSFERLLGGMSMLPDVVVAMLQWMADTSFMGEYTLLFPLALVFVLMHWKRYARPSGESVVLLTALVSVVPPVVVYLVTLPSVPWLSVNAMGRYLIVLSVMAYFIVAIHTVEAARAAGARAARVLFARTAVAVAGALLVVSLPTIVSKIQAQRVAWDFRNDLRGWRGNNPAVGPSGLGPIGGGASVATPPIRLDADLFRTIRIIARGTPGTSSRLTLGWKRLREEPAEDQNVSSRVKWTGSYQTIVLTPPWRGMVEQLVLRFDDPAGVIVRSVASEPAWVSKLGLMLRSERRNLAAFAAFVLILFAVMGMLSTRDDLQRTLAAGVASIILVFWLVTDVSPVLSVPLTGHDYTRPITLTRTVADYWSRLGGLDPSGRIEALEADAGRPRFAPLMRETFERCEAQGDVIVFAAPGGGDAQPGGYLHQRSAYLLLPRKVFLARQAEQLAELIRQRGVGGKPVYADRDGFMVVCNAS